jgi:TolB-like protein
LGVVNRSVALAVAAACLAAAAPLAAQCPDGSAPPCGRSAARAPAANSVAVLYFENLSHDTSDAYLADGLTEELITRLSEVRRLEVKSRFVSQRLRGQPATDPVILGRQVGAVFLVTGGVRRSGERVRVNAELMRAATGVIVWSRQLDHTDADILAIEEQVAREIATGITGELLPNEQATLARWPTHDRVAYDLYLRGNYLANKFTDLDLRAAITLYEQAFSRDSSFALAQAGIANAWFFLADDWVSPRDAYARTRHAAERALALDSSAPAATHLVLPALTLDYDIGRAEALAERALARTPGEANSMFSMMFVRLAQARRSDAAELALRAWEADTGSFLSALVVSANLGMAGAFDELTRFLPRARSAAPEGVIHGWEGVVLYGRGDCAGAAVRLREEHQVFLRGYLVPALVCSGQMTQAREELGALLRIRQASYRSAGVIAAAYGALGDPDSAFVWLDRAFEERDTFLLWIRLSPLVDPLRSDPRFDALLRRTWLAPRPGR